MKKWVIGSGLAIAAFFVAGWLLRPRPYGDSGMWLMYAIDDYRAQVICIRFREGRFLPFWLEQYAAHPGLCEGETFDNRYGLLGDGCQWDERTQVCNSPQFANWGQLGEEPEIGDRVPSIIFPSN